MIRIALPNKGSLSEEAIAIAKAAGYRCSRGSSKALSLIDKEHDIEFVFLRPRDIAVYVSQGVVEVGITGRDLNLDANTPSLEAMALNFGNSTFRYAVPNESDLTPDQFNGKRIACSYPTIVQRDLESRGITDAQIVAVDGAVEISIRLGVADAIADVVSSGQTLREAGLKTVGDPVMESEAIVIVQNEQTLVNPQVATFLKRLKGIIVARQYVMIEYNIPHDLLTQATAVTPGIEAPTIAQLKDPAWAAVKAMQKKKGLNAIVDQLADLGAMGIVVYDLRTCRL